MVWYDLRHRQIGAATLICWHCSAFYETARRSHPTLWSQDTRCWRQPDEVWINSNHNDTSQTRATIYLSRLKGSQGMTAFLKATGGGINRPWQFRRDHRSAVRPDGTTPEGRRYRCTEIGSHGLARPCCARATLISKEMGMGKSAKVLPPEGRGSRHVGIAWVRRTPYP